MRDTTITIYTAPVGKERPRMVRMGNKTIAYTPAKTRNFEKLIQTEYIRQKGYKYGNIPVNIRLELGYSMPKTASKTIKECMLDGMMLPCKRPDIDNVAKAILDGLNGLAYEDDKQVCELIIRKFYSEKEHIKIFISGLQQD